MGYIEDMVEVKLPSSLRKHTRYTLHMEMDVSQLATVTRNRVIRALQTGVLGTQSGIAYDLFVHLSNNMPCLAKSGNGLNSNFRHKELEANLEARALLVDGAAKFYHGWGHGFCAYSIKLPVSILIKEMKEHNILTDEHKRHANEVIKLLERGETITIDKRG